MPGRYVGLTIRDTGPGIPSNILKHVMDPFFTTKEEGKGTGLGLSMVYGFAKQSGGVAMIESEEGDGATVRMIFPASLDTDTGAPQQNRASDKGGSEKILVVDDRADVAELARAMLEDAGYSVETAANAAEALKMLALENYDMLFSDVIMPGGMNGVTLARKARLHYPQLKVLLTTGFAEAAIESEDDGGATFDTILKPYSRSDLIRKVRIILDGPTGVS